MQETHQSDAPAHQHGVTATAPDWHAKCMTKAVTTTTPCTARHAHVRSADRKSTRLELQSPCNLVCRLLLEKKKQHLNKPLEAVLTDARVRIKLSTLEPEVK